MSQPVKFLALQGFSWVAPTGCVPDSVPDSII